LFPRLARQASANSSEPGWLSRARKERSYPERSLEISTLDLRPAANSHKVIHPANPGGDAVKLGTDPDALCGANGILENRPHLGLGGAALLGGPNTGRSVGFLRKITYG
jgi:hypothetical protein